MIEPPSGVRLLSAKSLHEKFCTYDPKSGCEDFRDVPLQEILRFEARFPDLLKERGYAQEAERVANYSRIYWGVFGKGRLEVLGVLGCSERLDVDTAEILEPNPPGCSTISVTFPAGHPEQTAFTVE